jgi:hypothetical protein
MRPGGWPFVGGGPEFSVSATYSIPARSRNRSPPMFPNSARR